MFCNILKDLKRQNSLRDLVLSSKTRSNRAVTKLISILSFLCFLYLRPISDIFASKFRDKISIIRTRYLISNLISFFIFLYIKRLCAKIGIFSKL